MVKRPQIVPKAVYSIGSSLEDLRAFPDDVRGAVGVALRAAQLGGKHETAKPLKGFRGAVVLEIVEDHDGDTYRVVYTVRFPDGVYVLHVFQKKSRRRVATPKHVMDLIKNRLRGVHLSHDAKGAR